MKIQTLNRHFAALAATLTLAGPVLADSTSEIDAALSAVTASWDAGLAANTNAQGVQAFRVGEDMSYYFAADQDLHLIAVHRDSYGVAHVLVPSPLATNAHLKSGSKLSIEDLEAIAPVGVDVIYVFGTREPLAMDELKLDPNADELITFDAKASPGFAKRLAAELEALGAGAVARTEIRYEIMGRGEIEYTVGDVVAQLTPTRSVPRPRMAFHGVTFEFDSANLTDQARRNLDVVGQALTRRELNGEKFALGGHTDDVGAADYNKQLSERRANAAKQYLVERWEIPAQQIVSRGHGESMPAIEDMSDEARSQNRRVELEVLR